ncbi:MAG: alanine racemase [Pseudomonadota bacterium]
MSSGATATIDLAAVTHNLALIRRRAGGGRIMAAIKANAYGHGAVRVAKALHTADSFALARVTEASELRAADIRQPLVLLEGVFDADEMQLAGALDCELVVHSDYQIDLLAAYGGAPRVVWLKINTGMNRLGFAPSRAAQLITRLRALASVAEVRIMSHLACADGDDSAAQVLTGRQLSAFRSVIGDFDGAVSIANSAALLTGDTDTVRARDGQDPAAHWVRPGIALYGISPFAARTGADLGLRAAMCLQARIIAEHLLQAGDSVGYGARFVAPRQMRIGIVAAGYGDGYPRAMPDGTPVDVAGQTAVLAGRVSMDMLSIDLTGCERVSPGSSVCLWGPQLPAERIAARVGTIAYELVTCVTARVPRVYRSA